MRHTRPLALASLVLLLADCLQPAQAQVGPPPPPPPLPPLGNPPIPAGNPQSAAKIALGQALFWDEQLSLTGSVACGSCHMPRAGGNEPRTAQPNPASVHPGADQLFGTADDIVGSMGVPAHDAAGVYQRSALFGMAPQVGTRQSQSAINAAFPTTLFWDGRAGGSFLDPSTGSTLIANGGALENQATGPVVNSVEMAHAGRTLADVSTRIAGVRPLRWSPSVPAALQSWIAGRSYPQLFAEVYGSAEVTPARVAMAIASYERTLVANQTPHDLQAAGQNALTQAELAGLQAFQQAGCARCHGGPLLSDNAFHYIGARPQNADPGRFAVTGNNGDRGAMRTPPLRNLELSAPYMADGRFRTLAEVVAFYNRGGDFTAPNKDPRIVPLGLSPQQQAAIVTFLQRPLTDVRARDETGPFERPMLFSESPYAPRTVRAGVAGTGGVVPRLTAVEPAVAGSSEYTIGIDFARAGAVARVLIASNDPQDANASALLRRDLTIAADGSAALDLALPNGASLQGQTLYLRVYVEDPAATGGWSSTASLSFQLLEVGELLYSQGFED
ncbi:MAG: cytochrome c peroxidase [Lysobacterales bacterium]